MQRREGIKVVLVAGGAHNGAPSTGELAELRELLGPILVCPSKQRIVGETHRHLLLEAVLARTNGLGPGSLASTMAPGR
jgi:hypothetical protein